uniref:Triacylglycerol lipase n=1 Tax=Plectus sambesii TaxID=2011161 RepID=A0A914VS73_9BILA
MNAFGFEGIRQQFLKKGYTSGELYGTTWGSGSASTILDTDMKCEYVKQVRSLLLAVQKYTGAKVDVIGYSMGSPISRKAILGGKCVETGEDLGKPLTDVVDTFVGVAGANHGAALCFLQFGETCGKTIGLDCSSKFLADINGQKRKYEGHFVYSISSPEDDVVGYEACGTTASAIPNQDDGFKRSGNHDEVLQSTVQLQYSLIQNHKAA